MRSTRAVRNPLGRTSRLTALLALALTAGLLVVPPARAGDAGVITESGRYYDQDDGSYFIDLSLPDDATDLRATVDGHDVAVDVPSHGRGGVIVSVFPTPAGQSWVAAPGSYPVHVEVTSNGGVLSADLARLVIDPRPMLTIVRAPERVALGADVDVVLRVRNLAYGGALVSATGPLSLSSSSVDTVVPKAPEYTITLRMRPDGRSADSTGTVVVSSDALDGTRVSASFQVAILPVADRTGPAVSLQSPLSPAESLRARDVTAVWSAYDTSRITRFEVRTRGSRMGGRLGAWREPLTVDGAKDRVRLPVGPDSRVCVQVRGVDEFANTGPWSVSGCATVGVDDRVLRLVRHAHRATSASGHTVTILDGRGASVRLPGLRTATRVTVRGRSCSAALPLAVRLGGGPWQYVSLTKRHPVGSTSLSAGAQARTGRLQIRNQDSCRAVVDAVVMS